MQSFEPHPVTTRCFPVTNDDSLANSFSARLGYKLKRKFVRTDNAMNDSATAFNHCESN